MLRSTKGVRTSISSMRYDHQLGFYRQFFSHKSPKRVISRHELFNIPELQGSKDLHNNLIKKEMTSSSIYRENQQIPLIQGLQGTESPFEDQSCHLRSINKTEQSQGVQGNFRDFKRMKMPIFKNDEPFNGMNIKRYSTFVYQKPQAPFSNNNKSFVRGFSLSAKNGQESADVYPSRVEEDPDVQGIQGDGMSCVQFKTWLSNCKRFNIDCSSEIKNLTKGRKELEDIFEEQARMIRQIAADYRRVHSTAQGVEPSKVTLPHDEDHSFIQGTQQYHAQFTVENLLKMENPCPQGVQGHMCSRFKLWLHNCAKYGFNDCNEQLKSLQSGRKTLNDIFEEQDRMIDAVAKFYNNKNNMPIREVPDQFKEENLPDCSQLRRWLENCRRYGLNCDHQLREVQDGEKSMEEIFNDQKETIKKIARERRLTTGTLDLPPPSGPVTEISDTLEGLTVEMLLGMEEPCPTSLVNTPDADRFRMWLDNCKRYNFCVDEHLDNVQNNHMSVVEMMDDQDASINEIAEQYLGQTAEGPESLVGYTLPELYGLDNPCPQGVHGEDCERFKLWLENCAKYGSIADGEAQLRDVQSGRKTLKEVFEEQKIQIENHKKRQAMNSGPMAQQKRFYSTLSGEQGQVAGWDTNVTLEDLQQMSEPCPQGVQGMDCHNFKLWLDNCVKHGWSDDCEKQLKGIQTGRKTIAEVFAEQDMIIRKFAGMRSISGNTQNFYPSNSRFFSTVSSLNCSSNPQDVTQKSLTPVQKLKLAVKDYGSTVIVFHIGISLISLGGFYTAVSSGIDMVGLLEQVGIGESILSSRITSGASTFIVAYAVHKVFAPARIAITLTSAPFIVKKLRAIGLLKTPR